MIRHKVDFSTHKTCVYTYLLLSSFGHGRYFLFIISFVFSSRLSLRSSVPGICSVAIVMRVYGQTPKWTIFDRRLLAIKLAWEKWLLYFFKINIVHDMLNAPMKQCGCACEHIFSYVRVLSTPPPNLLTIGSGTRICSSARVRWQSMYGTYILFTNVSARIHLTTQYSQFGPKIALFHIRFECGKEKKLFGIVFITCLHIHKIYTTLSIHAYRWDERV